MTYDEWNIHAQRWVSLLNLLPHDLTSGDLTSGDLTCFLALIFSYCLKNGAAMGLEPQTNSHEPSYQTTRPVRDELPETQY